MRKTINPKLGDGTEKYIENLENQKYLPSNILSLYYFPKINLLLEKIREI